MNTLGILILAALAAIVCLLILFLMGVSVAKEFREDCGAKEGDDRNPTRDVRSAR